VNETAAIAEEKPQEKPAPVPDAEVPKPAAPTTRDVRGGILAGQRFITRESNYEASLFETWNLIKSKFSRYGFAHVGGRRLFNDTDGIYGGKAFLEMKTELVTFLYELGGNVDKKEFKGSIAAVREFVDWVDDEDYLVQIPLLYAQAANLFHNADIGFKRPKEKSIFNLNLKVVFSEHYAEIFAVGIPSKDLIAEYVEAIIVEDQDEDREDSDG
jgi:hypothetical protein